MTTSTEPVAYPKVTMSWLAARQIRRRGGAAYIWATDFNSAWRRLHASAVRPEGIAFDASVVIDGIEVHLGETVTAFAPWAGLAIGYRFFPRPGLVAWSLGSAAGDGGTSGGGG